MDAGGGCSLSTKVRAKVAWGRFRQLLPILTNRSISFATRGYVFNACIRPVLLYGSECWAMRNEDKLRLQRNDRAMIRWICGVKPGVRTNSNTLLNQLNIPPIESLLRARRLRWFGHVKRSEGWIKKCTEIDVEGTRGKGRPRKSWKQTINGDLKDWNLQETMAEDRGS